MAQLKSGCKAIDELIGGGLYTGATIAVFGIPDIGKTWFSLQLAITAGLPKDKGGLDSDAIYVDTEGMWLPEIQDQAFSFFQKRFKLPDEAQKRIHFKDLRNLAEVCDYFNIKDVHVEMSEGGKKLQAYVKTEPISKSQAYKDIEKYKAKFIVIDSVSNLIKSVIGGGTQNLDARSTILNPFMSALQNLAKETDTIVMSTHHVTKSPINPRDMGRPWGGDYILYNNKYVLQILRGLKEDREIFDRPRRFRRYRRAFMDEEGNMALVTLAKDYGYTDPMKLVQDTGRARPDDND